MPQSNDPQPIFSPQASRAFAREADTVLARLSALLRHGHEASGESVYDVVDAARADGIKMSVSKFYRLRHLTDTHERRDVRQERKEVDFVAAEWCLLRYGYRLTDVWPHGHDRPVSQDEDALLKLYRSLSPAARDTVRLLATAQAEAERTSSERDAANITPLPVREPSREERDAAALGVEQAAHEAQAYVREVAERGRAAREGRNGKRKNSNGR